MSKAGVLFGKTKRPYADALVAAQSIVDALRPACHRIEIAGSLRRKKETVGDIEIVAVPVSRRDLFGNPDPKVTALDVLLSELGVTFAKEGPKYKQFSWDGAQVDLFLANPVTWGVIFMLRTGSAHFSRRMVTPKMWGGLMPDDLHVEGGQVWRRGEALYTPEETNLFDLWGMQYIAPEQRD